MARKRQVRALTLSSDMLRGMTNSEFQALWDTITTEKARREAKEADGMAADQLIYKMRDGLSLPAHGGGEEWKQPVEFHEAYPQGSLVTFEGTRYVSDVHVNFSRPDNPLAWVPEGEGGEHDVIAEERTHERAEDIQGSGFSPASPGAEPPPDSPPLADEAEVEIN